MEVEFLLRKNKITIFEGTALLSSATTVKVELEDGAQELEVKNIIIATGARPFIISGVEVDGKQVVPYTEAILQEHLPKAALIIGARAIGMEFATNWNSYGVPVAEAEMLDLVLPNEDPEVRQELEKQIKRQGIKTRVSSKVTRVETLKTKVNVWVETPEGEGKLISFIRAAIEPAPSNPRYLHTVRVKGYKLDGN